MFNILRKKREMEKTIQGEMMIRELIRKEHQKSPQIPIQHIENCVRLVYAIEELKEDNAKVKRVLPKFIYNRYSIGIAASLFLSALRRQPRL